jgi:hypothetical protein
MSLVWLVRFVLTCALSMSFMIFMGHQMLAFAEEWAVHSFDIPAQSLKTSLERFAEQADIQMLYTLDAVEGLQAQAVQGSYSTEQALKTF